MLDRQISAASCHLSRTTRHPYKDLLGLMLAQREVVAADFDFHRVAERCKTNEFERPADQQPHFHEARTAFGRQFDFGHRRRYAHGNRTQRLGSVGHNLSGFGGDRLHQNGFGQLFTQGEAGVADLADDIGFTAQKFDALLLARPSSRSRSRNSGDATSSLMQTVVPAATWFNGQTDGPAQRPSTTLKSVADFFTTPQRRSRATSGQAGSCHGFGNFGFQALNRAGDGSLLPANGKHPMGELARPPDESGGRR